MHVLFQNRSDAGRQLAERLKDYADRSDVIVLALPRGGVPVGYEVARALRVPLDLFLVRKLGVPGDEELAFGAIASGGVLVQNEEVARHLRDAERVIAEVADREQRELQRREGEYRQGRAAPELTGKTVILVDDGLATGSTMRAAVVALRRVPDHVGRLIVAVPVGSQEGCAEFRAEVDDVVCLVASDDFRSVGQFYEDFSQTSDEEVRELLARAANREGSA